MADYAQISINLPDTENGTFW